MTGTETARRVIHSAWLFFLQIGGWLLHGIVVGLVLIVKVVEGVVATSAWEQSAAGADSIDQGATFSKQAGNFNPQEHSDSLHGDESRFFGLPYRGLKEEQQGTEAVVTEELAEYSGETGGGYVLDKDALVSHPDRDGVQTMLSNLPGQVKADFKPPLKDDAETHDVQHGDKRVDDVEKEASDSSGPSQGPSHLSVKVDELQTKTASLMHRLEKIEVPRKLHEDETKDSIQGIPNIVAAPETPLTPLTTTHGPQMQPSASHNAQKTPSAGQEGVDTATTSGDATIQLRKHDKPYSPLEHKAEHSAKAEAVAPEVNSKPNSAREVKQGDNKRDASPAGRRGPFQKISKGFKRIFA